MKNFDRNIKLKSSILVSGVLLSLMGACSKNPNEGSTLNLKFDLYPLAKNRNTGNASTTTVYAPVYIYFKITDNNGNPVDIKTTDSNGVTFPYNPVVSLYDSVISSYKPNVTISLSGIGPDVSSVKITGHFLATSVQVSDPSNISLITAAMCGSSSTPGNFLGTHSNTANAPSTLYIKDFDLSPQNIALTSKDNNASIDLSHLVSIPVDSFAFKITDGNSALSGASVYLYDSDNSDTSSAILNPCTGQPFQGTTDSSGRIATNLPIGKLSSSTNNFNLKVVPANSSTPTIFNIASLTPASNSVVTCSGQVTHYNSDGTPIFWNLNTSAPGNSSLSAPMDPNSTTISNTTTSTYLTSSEMSPSSALAYTGSICGRLNAFLNPRFADVPVTQTSGPVQSHLKPIDSSVTPTTTYSTGAVFNSSAGASDHDLLLIDPAVNTTSYFSGQNSLNSQQQIKVYCTIADNPTMGPGTFTSLIGSVNASTGVISPASITSYGDCTSIGTVYGLDSNGIRQGLASYLFGPVVSSTYLNLNFFYQDLESYLVFSSFLYAAGGSVVPSIAAPGNASMTKVL